MVAREMKVQRCRLPRGVGLDQDHQVRRCRSINPNGSPGLSTAVMTRMTDSPNSTQREGPGPSSGVRVWSF
ncbi:MAG: hypothetical protein CMJ51_04360 [Planctomycetaceae bacterium]|nr:hypothetical protein [Planctomycetaceae bacterium]